MKQSHARAMLEEERTAVRTGNSRGSTVIPRRRDSVGRKLAVRRQIKEEKKSRSVEKNEEIFYDAVQEERDAPSSTAAFPTKQNTKDSSDQRDEINDIHGYGCFLSPFCMQDRQNEEDESDRAKADSKNLSNQTLRLSSVTSFHVRLSIGKMNGLKIDETLKRVKDSKNRGITVGFVQLMGSGKYSAMSKPLLIDVEEATERTRSICWTHQLDEESSKSKSRRCLHFSLSLKNERSDCHSYEGTHDNDDSSVDLYKPEVVKLLVGLKCGDERLPLGIVRFVVNGKEVIDQHMDLTVVPVTDPAAGYKSKRGMLGKKYHTSFQNGKFDFSIARNAKLRIKADVKVGYPGQNGEEIWGDQNCSYTSAFDSAAVAASGNIFSSKQSSGFPTIKVPSFKWRGRKSSQNRSFRKRSGKDSTSYDKDYYQDPKAPTREIALDKFGELVSADSDISSRPGCLKACACEPLQCLGFTTKPSTVQDHGYYYNEDLAAESEEMSESEIENLFEELRNMSSSGSTCSSGESSSCE